MSLPLNSLERVTTMSRILVALRGVHFSDWLWISAVGVGVVLRVFALGGQIPVNDEWHAIHAMQELKPAFLLTRYGASDYSIPLTAYFLAVGHTFGLSEFSMRLPLLVAGIATLILLPSMVRPIVGRRAAAIFAWLLALSPILIFFSRMARPYAIVSLFAVWGLVAFQRTWEQGKLRSAVKLRSLRHRLWTVPCRFSALCAGAISLLWHPHPSSGRTSGGGGPSVA